MAKQAIHKIFALDKPSSPSESKSQPEESVPLDAPKKEEPFNWTGSWAPEIIAAVFSTVCIAMLIGFLIYIFDRPYAAWGYRVSPNAVISVIVTAAKATMLVLVPSCLSQLKWNQYQKPTPLYHMQLYDQASRGAWGSFQILWRITPGLATMGALLMILSLAIDPFAQQILAFPSRSVLASNETASVQAAHTYGKAQGHSAWQTIKNISSDYDLSPTMNAAILNGLAQTNEPLDPQCSSGNCQYPDFVTLGFCSRCQDITSQTNQTCKVDPSISKVQSKFGWSDLILHVPENCTYTLPDGYEILAQTMEVNYNYTVWKMGLHNTPVLSTKRQKWMSFIRGNGRAPALGIQQPVLSFISSRYANEINVYTRDNYTTPEKKPDISMCTIYACEKQYKNNVYSGGNGRLRLYKEQQLGPNVNVSDPDISQVTLVPPDQMEQLSPNSTYSIESYTWSKIDSAMHGLFRLDNILMFGLNMMAATIMGGIDNADATMDAMTTSMTNIMRSDTTTGFTIPGKAFRHETYIKVRWPWIILPTLAILFSIMLLIATATTSRRLNTMLWKDSVLPLLMFRLRTDSAEDIESLSKVDEAERVSKQIKVVGGEKGSPLVFSEVKDGFH
ncbi:DUF3176 domain-containing protein [Aspergillus glaucus CBS 516.65]|uniref:Uncharacterized protein n=1 Tax=Aspergillus glaucus CBS 516.65 TaxID=1160497 RepID=A0A1L9V9Y8_ASPGL|nr:hypothetical protein ASPGLDRAFT_51161 [Aspergillus glaucus CBS 516.65]OJJ80738.1 hypothetical protein ASPGLDRAFT_51161 [Aspergillus glaucus CBS 516.65]